MNEPFVEPILAVEPEPSFKTNAPLIPRDSVAGRALVVVIAIMTFLACLTAGAALLVADASQAWRSDVLRDATIQVKARPGDDVDGLVAKAVAIAAQSCDRNLATSAHAPHHGGAGVGYVRSTPSFDAEPEPRKPLVR